MSHLRVLNVVEKPSKAEAISEILAHGGARGGLDLYSRPGHSRFNRVFVFDYTIGRHACNMIFTSVTDFDAFVHIPQCQWQMDIKRTLEEEARRCQWLVLWLDCNREGGENMAFEVVEVCTGANRNLNVRRARFSALIDREIHESVQNLVRLNKLFADAVDARQVNNIRTKRC